MRKYKQLLSLLMCLIMMLSLMPMTVLAADSLTVTIDTGASVTLNDTDGDGYYEIGTANELYAFAAAVNGGNTGIYVELVDDITVNENVLNADGTLNGTPARVWTPIGKAGSYFSGSFSANYHTISGLYGGNGLFSTLNKSVQYLTIKDSYFTGTQNVGSIAGTLGSTGEVRYCTNYGTVSGNYAGGIVGNNTGTVGSCINHGFVTGNYTVGGIVGKTTTSFGSCINAGKVYGSGSGVGYIGAVVGYRSSGNITRSFYLEGCATTDKGTVQRGMGASGTESSEAYKDSIFGTVSTTAEQFKSGEVTWKTNNGSAFPFKQTIGTDAYPNFTGAAVYRYYFCNNTNGYTNDEAMSGKKSIHVWEAGACSLCSKVCEHGSYIDSLCTICGAECSHSWSNGVCTLCNVTCTHESYSDGSCASCGKECSHSYDSNNKCTICGITKVLYSGTFGAEGDNLTWKLDADGLLTILGIGDMGDYFSAPYAPWYQYRNSILRVKIQNGITGIGQAAFQWCESVTEFSLPDTITSIRWKAFSGCTALESIQLPSSLTLISGDMFYSCYALKEITIPNGVTAIDSYAFGQCHALAKVTIPESVTSIGERAFVDCKSLEEINIPEGVTTLDDAAFSGCIKATTVYIPSTLTGIDYGCFYNCSSLTDIYYNGYENQWNQITIGTENECLTGAIIHFKECTEHSWTNGTCGNCGAVCEHSYVDGTCSVCGAVYPYIAEGTCGENLTWTLDADGVLTISGSGAMKDYYNNDQNFPWYQHLQSIKTVVVEEGVTKISSHAFENCSSLTEVTLSKGLSTIDTRAFSKCTNLTSITLPESLYKISAYAFEGCVNLTSITIPAKTTSIFPSAFSCCSGLNGIWVDPNNTAYSNDSFGVLLNKAQTRICIAPANLSGDYVCPETVTRIGNNAFEGCSKITSVTMSGLVSTIEYNAFSNCGSLTEITIPDTVTYVEEYAFSNCNKLTDVYYGGTEEQWTAITVGSDNTPLTSATIHYEACIYTDKHTFTDGVCTQCGAEQLKFYGTNTTLGTVLDLNFAVEKSLITDEGSYAKLVRTYADGKTHEVTLAKADWIVQGDLYLITYEDLAAKEMCDVVSVQIFNSADVQISETKTDSIRSYAMRCIKDDTDKYSKEAKVLLMKMLDYGAAAQTEFKHNTSDPANNLITEAQRTAYPFEKQPVTNSGSEVAGQYMGTSLILENAIEMQMGFYGDPAGVTAAVSYTDHYGKAHSYTTADKVRIAEYKDADENVVAYGVIIPEIVVADARQPVTVTVTPAEGMAITVTDSIASYAARHNSEGVYGAIMDFADAAYVYFRSLETT